MSGILKFTTKIAGFFLPFYIEKNVSALYSNVVMGKYATLTCGSKSLISQ